MAGHLPADAPADATLPGQESQREDEEDEESLF
jgi:hypothetical protein